MDRDASARRWRVGRLGALLSASSAVLHAFTLSHAGPIVAFAMCAMIAACLFCAYELATRNTTQDWVRIAVMNIVMIGAHLPAMAGHHDHRSVSAVVSPASGAMAAATVVALLEVVLAVAVLLHRTRSYSAQLFDVGNGTA